MFDLSFEKIVVLVMVALFVLGPERLPAAAWLARSIRQAKHYATAAREQLSGPEFEEFRAPLAELREPLQELRLSTTWVTLAAH